MSISIMRIKSNMDPIKFYGHLSHDHVNKIREMSMRKNFKCLKYIEGHDNAFFNRKQTEAIKQELNTINEKDLQNAISLIGKAIEEMQSPKELLAFGGD